jgi:hypothetical protein
MYWVGLALEEKLSGALGLHERCDKHRCPSIVQVDPKPCQGFISAELQAENAAVEGFVP